MRTRIPNAPTATAKNFVLFERPAIARRMTTGLAPCHIPGRRARHAAACRLRFFLSRHGSRREPSRSGPGFRELRKSEIRRPAETYGRSSLWPQRTLHVHNGTGAPDPVSEN